MQILLQHLLGDIISPPIIGAISDGTGQLRNGLQICWVALIFSGVCWGAGYFFLKPVEAADSKSPEDQVQILQVTGSPLMSDDPNAIKQQITSTGAEGTTSTPAKPQVEAPIITEPTFYDLLCLPDGFKMENNRVVRRHRSERTSSLVIVPPRSSSFTDASHPNKRRSSRDFVFEEDSIFTSILGKDQ